MGEILGTITRLADGHGYSNDSGAWGHRGYGDTMFVWTGAAVDIPHNVYKMLSTLGFKIYFYRLPYIEKTDNQLLECTDIEFNDKIANIVEALYKYLAWFEIGPDLIHDEQSKLSKMPMAYEKDEYEAKIWIVRLARLLGHLRCIAITWRDKSDSTGSTWGFSVSQPESPERAIHVLKNFARGHALSSAGRNYITLEDIPIIVKVVLSTAHLDKVALIDFLISNKGTVVTKQVQDYLNVSRPTALRNMTELVVTGVVDSEDDVSFIDDRGQERFTRRITLKKEFQWLLDEDFKKLRENFKPVDNREFLKEGTKEKENNSKGSFPSSEQISVFWLTFSDLESAAKHSMSEMDKTTVSGEELRDALVSSGKFTTSDAVVMIKYMVEAGFIEQPAWDTYRKKAR